MLTIKGAKKDRRWSTVANAYAAKGRMRYNDALVTSDDELLGEAGKCYETNLRMFKRLYDRSGDPNSTYNYGCALLSRGLVDVELGEFDQAHARFTGVREIAEETGNQELLGHHHCAVSRLESYQGRFDSAAGSLVDASDVQAKLSGAGQLQFQIYLDNAFLAERRMEGETDTNTLGALREWARDSYVGARNLQNETGSNYGFRRSWIESRISELE